MLSHDDVDTWKLYTLFLFGESNLEPQRYQPGHMILANPIILPNLDHMA